MSSQNQFIIVFGLPAAGKTYVGEILEKHFGFFHYDGDTDLTEEMKEAVKSKTPFTDAMRDVFFAKLLGSCAKLLQEHKKLVVSQTFIKEKYRKEFLQAFPFAQFILVETETKVREQRLQKRHQYPLDLEYSKQMVTNFEKPTIYHTLMVNDEDGKVVIKQKLEKLIQSISQR